MDHSLPLACSNYRGNPDSLDRCRLAWDLSRRLCAASEKHGNAPPQKPYFDASSTKSRRNMPPAKRSRRRRQCLSCLCPPSTPAMGTRIQQEESSASTDRHSHTARKDPGLRGSCSRRNSARDIRYGYFSLVSCSLARVSMYSATFCSLYRCASRCFFKCSSIIERSCSVLNGFTM